MNVLYLLGWPLLLITIPGSAQEASSLRTGPGDEIVAAFACLLAVLLATYFPARRAARVDPMEVLRTE